MAWFKKTRKPIETPTDKASRVPEGLWVKCPSCGQVIYNKELVTNLQVCPKCAHHFRMNAADRLAILFDDGQWTEHDADLRSTRNAKELIRNCCSKYLNTQNRLASMILL